MKVRHPLNQDSLATFYLTLIRGLRTAAHRKEEPVGLRESTFDPKIGEGTLTLTDRNLSLVRQRGFLSKSIETLFVLPVENISKVKLGHQKLHIESMGQPSEMDFNVKDPKGWMLQIKKFKQRAGKAHRQPSGSGRVKSETVGECIKYSNRR